MKYSGNTTLNHHIAKLHKKCLQDINLLIGNEGYIGHLPLFPKKEIVINTDLVEKEIRPKSRKKSMDMAFGVTSKNSKMKKILMVELKFRKKEDFKKLSITDIEEKASMSKTVLKGAIPLYDYFIIIFSPDVKKQAFKKLSQLALKDPKRVSKFKIQDIYELKSDFF